MRAVSAESLQRLLEHRERFLVFLQRRVESREVAEDILQSSFVRMMERGGDLRDHESTIAWFYRVLRNAVIDHYRHQAVKGRALEAWAQEMQMETAADPLVYDTICTCIRPLLSDLKPEYQQALQLVDLEEHSLHALAQQAGISDSNAGVRVHRARQALRKQVTLTCGTCSEHGCVDCTCKVGAKKTG